MNAEDWQETWHALWELLGSKWAFHVLRLLHTGPHGFNEMKRQIDGLTAAMLSRRLKELTCHGFVERQVTDTNPPTTTYRLTAAGTRFAEHAVAMEELVTVADCADTAECATNVPTISGTSGTDACCVGLGTE